MTARANVLLVDDQPDNLVALGAVLEPLGHNLIKASSGDEALKLLLRHDFAVILLDVHMPGLDGFETAALIKKRERTRHVPIIFVTGASKDTEHVFRGYSEGAVDYLLKPYDPAVLRSKVAVFVQLYEQTARLEASEQRFRTAFANAPGGMALVSETGKLLQVNDAFAELLGRSAAQLLGAQWRELLHPDDVNGRPATPVPAEQRLLHADGRELLVELSVSAMPPDELIVQMEDVTERKRTERETAERQRERAAHAEAEAAAQIFRSLQRVSDAALAHLALDDLLPELLDRVIESLGADMASVLLTDTDGETLVLRATRGAQGPQEGVRIPFGRASFAGRVAKERHAIVVGDIQAEEAVGVVDPSLLESGVRSLIGAPLIADGQVSGVIRAGSLTPNRFDQDAATLLALVSDRAALAIANARLYDREHRVVETLQRSLLPARLPRLPGISVAARYLPGGADVGGDWYDAIPLDDGRLGLAMGDVVGHGIEAAALMGELRNALRAYAIVERSPRAVVTRLDGLVKRLGGDQMATLLYAVLDPIEGTIRYTSAGHPPPLLVGPDGDAEYLWDGRSTPLGVEGMEFEEGEALLPDGAMLALFTDGLVEVPGETLDQGLERLRATVLDAPLEPDELCAHVIDQLRGEGLARDDVALIALRTVSLASELVRLEVPTDPSSLRQARQLLKLWLARHGAGADESWAISLACHEACTNAAEHAYGFGDSLFELEASITDGEFAVSVRDAGGWREPAVRANRGRGLGLMRALMDHVDVEGGPDGTIVELRRRLGAPVTSAA